MNLNAVPEKYRNLRSFAFGDGPGVLVETIGRAPNGKVDYKRLKALAGDRVAAPT